MTATKRFLRVILPFERMASGRLLGSIRIVCPQPYPSDDCYMVSIGENDAIFMKEDKARTNHVVDLDFMACDCKAWNYRKTCRHTAALETLKKQGKI